MASQIEHVYQPDAEAVANFEQLYQGYLSWSAQTEPLYALSPKES
jgi:ribulose kinase